MDTPQPREYLHKPQPGEYLLQYRDERDGYIPQYAPRKEWGSDTSFDPDDLVDIEIEEDQVGISLLSVMRNVLGYMVYIVRLEDSVNIPQGPVRFELWVDERSLLNIIQLSAEEEQTFLREKLPRGYQVLPEAIKEVEYQEKPFRIVDVMANSIGDVVYIFYLKDSINLTTPLRGDLYIRTVDGKIRLQQTKHPEQLILGMRPELQG